MKEQNSVMSATEVMETLPFKGVIFDMDGTLLESTEADYKAWEKVFEKYGKTLTYDDYAPLLGVRSADVIRNILGKTEAEDVDRILKEKYDFFIEYINSNPIRPVLAADVFLKSLASFPVKVALATSSRNAKMKLVLTQLNFLKYFPVTVTGEEVKNSKPAPDIFLKAAERMGLHPADCVVVEDGPVGVAAAKSAGMKCIAITATHPADKLQQADIVIDTYENASFSDLCNRLSC